MARNHCSLVVYRLSGAGKANFEPPNTTIGSPSSSYIYIVVLIILTVKIGGKNARMSNTKKAREKNLYFQALIFWRRGGDYIAPFFHNSLVFYHFIRKTRIFCRLRPSLSSLIRLSNALRSLLWTTKALKKSNMSNKPGPSLLVGVGA